MLRRADLVWKLAVPVACLFAGGVAGYRFRDARVPQVLAHATAIREGGYQFVNPLLECDRGGDLVQSEELAPFRERVEAHLRALRGPDVGSVSVYFRELNDGLWFSIGEAERFAPASLRKVPLMIAALKEAEAAPELLMRPVRNDLRSDHAASQNFRPSVTLEPGQEYTVAELIRRMIVYSDNNAFMLMSRQVDPAQIDRAYAQLAGGGAGQAFLSVYTYASFFRVLYNASYVGKQLSEWALGILARSEFREGIVAGVPPGVAVAHKFGEHSDGAAHEVQLHDCGIVYAPGRPYLLCVMSRGRSFEHLDEALASTSRLIYAEVTGDARAHASR